MSPRTGRPTSNPKVHRTSFRLSDEDVEKLEVCARVTGLSKTEIVRKGIDKVYQELNKKK